MSLWTRFDDVLRYLWVIFGVFCFVATAQAGYDAADVSDVKQDAILSQFVADRQKAVTDLSYGSTVTIWKQVQQRILAGTATDLDRQFLQFYQAGQLQYQAGQSAYTLAKNSYNQGNMLLDGPNPLYDPIYELFSSADTDWTDSSCDWQASAASFNAGAGLYKKK